jgi:hypothetical protein
MDYAESRLRRCAKFFAAALLFVAALVVVTIGNLLFSR